jgi:hypothetical protein
MPKYDYIALDPRQGNQRLHRSRQPERGHRPREGNGFVPHQDCRGRPARKKPPARRPSRPAGKAGGKKGGGGHQPRNQNPRPGRRVKPKVLTTFTRQLATLVDAGLPLLRGLRVLEKQERNATLKGILGELALAIEGGSTFSEALAQHPKVFNRLFVNMVKAGELGGVLEVVLKRLAEFIRKGAEDQRQGQGRPVLSRGRADRRHGHHDFVDGLCDSQVQGGLRRHEHGQAHAGFTLFVLAVSDAVKDHFLPTLGGVAVFVVVISF